MKIFISWSGQKSKKAALTLRSWLPDVIQNIEPWMSSEDIGAGSRWSREIEEQLQQSNFGIICLTKKNASAPWINFEAGAIAKSVKNSSVCPYLLDLKNSEIPRGPLNLFQGKLANHDQTWELLKSINISMPAGSLSDQQLERTFERWWPDLERTLSVLPEENEDGVSEISEEEAIEEILDTVRSISRRMQRDDMERDLIRAVKGFSKKIPSIGLGVGKMPVNSILKYDYDVEDKARQQIKDMNFEELEKIYKILTEKQQNEESTTNKFSGESNEN